MNQTAIQLPAYLHCIPDEIFQKSRYGVLTHIALQMVRSIHFVISRPIVFRRPPNSLIAFLLAPQIRLLLTMMRVYKLHTFTYLHFVSAMACPQ